MTGLWRMVETHEPTMSTADSQLADVQFQIETARRNTDRRLYLLAACELEAAATILRLVHFRQKTEE
jgi:hypothetical protein